MISPAIRQETIIFLLAALHGTFLTVGYDVLRGLRRAIPHSEAAVSAEDFFYWIAAGFLTFLMAFSVSEGVLRGYAAVAMALGALLYLETFSRFVQKIAAGFFGFFCFLAQKGVRFAVKICGKAQKRIEIKKKKRYNKAEKARCEKKAAGQRGIRNDRKKKNRKKEAEQK